MGTGGLLRGSAPSGAEVYLGGKSVGRTPLTLRNLVAKGHRLVLRKVGYEDLEREITVLREQITEPEGLALKPFVGSARIEMDPAGWDVRLDSKELLADGLDSISRQGLEPVSWEGLPIGTYRIALEKPFWGGIWGTLKVERGREAVFEKKFSSGTVTLSCNLEGAKAHIQSVALLDAVLERVDSQGFGLPLDGVALPTGRYEVEVAVDGWEPLKLPLNVVGGQSVSYEANFLYGTVNVESEPSGAEVWSLDRKLGVTPLELKAPPGTASYTLKMNGHRPAEVSGLIVADGNLHLQQTLEDFQHDVPGIGLEMLKVSPGTFLMGSPAGEADRDDDEVQHHVTLTKAFWLGKYEVTQGQWKAVMGDNPSNFTGDGLPVEKVSWEDAMEFCGKLDRMDGNKPRGYVYSLPTEAQWEYACRAGTTTATAYGESLSSRQANFDGDNPYGGAPKGPYLSKTTPVGSYRPNAWGFYDMHGNVREWCQDRYGDYPGSSVSDPEGPSTGASRVGRGGSWGNVGRYCRSADRDGSGPGLRDSSLGFRLVLSSNP